MLTITIPARKFFNNSTCEFSYTKEATLQLEHSLISLSEWESKWKKPFMSSKGGLTADEFRDYIRCMTITKNVDPMVYFGVTQEIADLIIAYIDDPMTATWFSDDKNGGSKQNRVITAELIYYWMIAQNIPFECRKWHLNRLLTLIRVCSAESQPKEKRKLTKNDIAARKAENARRKARLNTRG